MQPSDVFFGRICLSKWSIWWFDSKIRSMNMWGSVKIYGTACTCIRTGIGSDIQMKPDHHNTIVSNRNSWKLCSCKIQHHSSLFHFVNNLGWAKSKSDCERNWFECWHCRSSESNFTMFDSRWSPSRISTRDVPQILQSHMMVMCG
jgi:hypothetical protein